MAVKLCSLLLLAGFVAVQGQNTIKETSLEISKAANSFGTTLHRIMAEIPGKNKNSFFSPLSIYSAFAMVSAGARGNTLYQLQKALNWNSFSSPKDNITGHQKIKQYMKWTLYSSTSSPLKLANKLWLQKYFCTSVCKKYVKNLQENYYTSLGIANFHDFPDKSRKEINEWVAENTGNKIKDLLEAGTVRSTTRLVLTNAVYFKQDWKYQFDVAKTKVSAFHVSKNKSVDVKMMTMKTSMPYTEDEESKVIELPYTSGTVSMFIILPKDRNGIRKLEQSLDNDLLTKYITSVYKSKVNIAIPKFKLTSDIHLKDYFSLMGVRDVFDPFRADLSAMAGFKGLFITHAIHKGFIDVSEEGTEAAASTGITASFRSFIPSIFEFNANHPFLYAIVHKATNSVLFLGRMSDPTETNSSPH